MTNQQNALATIGRDEWGIMLEQASVFVKSGFLPSAIKTPEQAIIVMLTGRELGIGTMEAFRQIAVVNGKPVIQGSLMLKLVERAYGRGAMVVDIAHCTDRQAVIKYRDLATGQYQTYTYTIEQAQAANLTGKQTWQQYPQNMLIWRAVANVARAAFPAAIDGVYTPDEMGATVNEDGEYIDVPSTPPHPRPQVQVQEVPRPAVEVVTEDGEIVSQDTAEPETDEAEGFTLHATKDQIAEIHMLARSLGLSRTEYEEEMYGQVAKRSAKEMTETEATKFIAALQKKLSKVQEQQPQLIES